MVSYLVVETKLSSQLAATRPKLTQSGVLDKIQQYVETVHKLTKTFKSTRLEIGIDHTFWIRLPKPKSVINFGLGPFNRGRCTITAGRCRDFGFLPLEPSQKGEMPLILTIIVVVASIVIVVRNFLLGLLNS